MILLGKFYAVKNGRKPGIYESWDECKAQVDGYSGAIYKSFKLKSDALEFLGADKAESPEKKQNIPVWYVDGSYNINTKEYAFGAVLLWNGEEKTFNKKFPSDSLASMRNVAGEIKGAEFAMAYSKEAGFSEISIYYDYTGIENWALGNWKANLEGTKSYVAAYREISKVLKVNFEKVKGHSGDKYNDLADKLAKGALGINA